MAAPKRPVLRWHGGKWRLAPWIISHFPAHRVYVEPFGGAASVLLRKERTPGEVYNDLDGDVVNLFRCLQDPIQSSRLVRLLRYTPYAEDEFKIAYRHTDDPLEAARRLVIRSYMGFGSNSHSCAGSGGSTTGFRANSNRSGGPPARDWFNYPDAMLDIIDRMRGVTIQNRDAMAVARQHDDQGVLHYFDPPYLPQTRSISRAKGGMRSMYRHELQAAHHSELLTELQRLKGYVVLSGYPNETYDAALHGWRRVERAALADGAKPRTEVLWINRACAEALDQRGPQMGQAA